MSDGVTTGELLPGLVGAALVAIVPPTAILLLAPGSAAPLAWGAILWGVGVALKTVVAGVVHVRLAERVSVGVMSALQGLVSAVCELGIAAIWLVRHRPVAFDDAVAFGVGAGSIEALVLVAYSLWHHVRGQAADAAALQQWRDAASRSGWVRFAMPIERFAAFLGHVGARGLVALGTGSASLPQGLILLLLPLASFAAVDGLAGLGHAKKWDWVDPDVARRFYSLVLLIGVLELAAFVVFALLRW